MIIIAILLFAFVTLSLATVQRNEHFSIIREGKMTSAVKKRWAMVRVVVFGVLGFGFWVLGDTPGVALGLGLFGRGFVGWVLAVIQEGY